MARCPFATFQEINGPVGPYVGGPFKIVHHTTEGSTYAGAKAAYKANRSEPHFTVAGAEIFQHIDTSLASRSLRNPPGGVETNRDSAVQIEVVGFAGSPKDIETLRSVARLCRFIEEEHGVPQVWPNGRPRASTNGRDPGGHNRNAETWDATGGHYGHSQVPENIHWDPGYTAAELAIVTPDAVFDPHDELAIPTGDVALTAFASDRSPASESADAIAQRVLAGLSSSLDAGLVGPRSRVTIRVASGGVEVELTLDGASLGAPPSRTSRSRLSRPSRTKKERRR